MDNKKIIVERGANFFTDSEGEAAANSCEGARKLGSVDWEAPLHEGASKDEIFEVRFKNTRKGYYHNVNGLILKVGDIVAVESSPGHDIGIISLTGNMVKKQMRCKGFNPDGVEFKKIYRIAKGGDITKWQEAIALEHNTMIKTRRIADSLGLNMKIGDVEYQGDKIKAIFYYIADARVDFRELIKILADEFKIRIEMKQIGARQEAGRIGGIGSCGRELCCSTWVTNFVSVTTNSARFQEISLNPQKLAGQCGKLKCCLNYEVDSYIDARKSFPRLKGPLETLDAQYFLVKSDIIKGEMVFSSDPSSMVNVVSIPISRVREIMNLNRKGVKVDTLRVIDANEGAAVNHDFANVVGDESITRFDKGAKEAKRRNNRKGGSKFKKSNNQPANEQEGGETETKPEVKKTHNNPRSKPQRDENRGGNGEPKVRRENREANGEPRVRREVREGDGEPKVKREAREGDDKQQPRSSDRPNNRPRKRWNNNRKGGNGNKGGNESQGGAKE